MINEFGGEIPETYGVPLSEIQEGIKHGVRKVNIDTDLRLASTAAIRKHLAANKAEFDPRKYLKDSQDAMKKVVIERYEAFATAGRASCCRCACATAASASPTCPSTITASCETSTCR